MSCASFSFFHWSVAFPNKCSDDNLLIFMDWSYWGRALFRN